ncbi:hypothetical protein ACQPXH_20555 [Nocardia sp. CA-135953]|uniref:hypothetical protein n=1 Tax=Nocardia sp. CA-135953 TaxID=3239978 RepID=UPI003D974F6A
MYERSEAFPTLPGTVRAARWIINIFAIIGVVGTVGLAAFRDSYVAGANSTGYLFFWILAIVALFFRRGGNGVRVAAIVLAILQSLIALGSVQANSSIAMHEHPGMNIVRYSPGPIGLIAAFVIVVLLCQGSAGRWFKRPRLADR